MMCRARNTTNRSPRWTKKLPRRPSSRAGYKLIEVLMAGVLLTTVATTLVPGVVRILEQRRLAEQQVDALAEVNAQLELLRQLPWQELTPERASQATIDPRLQGLLPEPQLKVDIAELPGAPLGRRIEVRLDWQLQSGARVTPVRLSTIVYPREPRS